MWITKCVFKRKQACFMVLRKGPRSKHLLNMLEDAWKPCIPFTRAKGKAAAWDVGWGAQVWQELPGGWASQAAVLRGPLQSGQTTSLEQAAASAAPSSSQLKFLLQRSIRLCVTSLSLLLQVSVLLKRLYWGSWSCRTEERGEASGLSVKGPPWSDTALIFAGLSFIALELV